MSYSDPTHRLLDQIVKQLCRIADCMEAEQKKPKRQQKQSQEECEDFEAFWSLYPRKAAKKAALKKWKALNLTDRQRAAAVLPRWLDAWGNSEMRFIPHASTWLNQARFEEEIEQALPTPQQDLSKLSDHDLYNLAQEKGVNSHGLNRNQLIDRLKTR